MAKKFKSNYFAGMIGTHDITRANGTKYKIRNHRQRIFMPDEWMVFYDALNRRQKVTFHFLINTGARINEVRNICVQDIDFDRNSIILRWTKARNHDGSRRMRVLAISTQFTKWLKAVIKFYKLKPEDKFPILCTPPANTAMKSALIKIGIPDYTMFSVHNVRKTLETWLIALEIDSLKVSKHFGHSIMIASKFYVSPDTFNYEDKKAIRGIIGDLYYHQQRF